MQNKCQPILHSKMSPDMVTEHCNKSQRLKPFKKEFTGDILYTGSFKSGGFKSADFKSCG